MPSDRLRPDAPWLSLTVDRRAEPNDIADVAPRFAWRQDQAQPRQQISYRIVVRERAIGAMGDGCVIWDTGTVATARAHEIPYEGAPLKSMHHYAWTVLVTLDGAEADASSWFETGRLSARDWESSTWITAPPVEDGIAPVPRLSASLELDDGFTAARLYIAAGGYAATSINGSPTSDAVLSPSFTDYEERVAVVVEDVTSLLRAGSNRIDVDLGRGFYGLTNPNPAPAWGWHTAPWHDEPCVRLELRVSYPDGATRTLGTGPSWRATRTATVYDDLYAGEVYDDAAASGEWLHAVPTAGPAGVLVAQRHQPIRVVERLAPDTITDLGDGRWVVGFPRVVSGWISVTVPPTATGWITLRYGEKLGDDGIPNFVDGEQYFEDGFQRDAVRLGGRDDRRWHPRFTYHGFRYVLVEGWLTDEPPQPRSFECQVVHTDAARVGSFASSSPLLNVIHENVVRTMLINLHGIPTDTPTYEKNGWTGDGMLGAEMFLRNLDVHNLFAKWVQDIEDSRRDDGRPRVIAPNPDWDDQFTPSPTWDSAYILVPWWLYRAGGDRVVLERHYEGMRRYALLEYGQADDGITTTKLNDWVSPETSAAGGESPDDPRVSATAFLYASLSTMSRIAGVLGHESDVALFDGYAAHVRVRFVQEFFEADGALVRGVGDEGYRQTHAVLALAFGLIPAEAERAVAARLAEDVRARGGLNTGALGTKWLLPVLSRFGYDDVALDIALSDRFPSWGHWVAHGATTTWEHWKIESRSRAHYFLGTVDDWLFEHVAGVRATEAGYARFEIDPLRSDRLSWAKASVPTPRGDIVVDWRREAGRFELEARVPPDARARIVLPLGALRQDAGPPSSEVASDGASRVLAVGPGWYRFAVRPDDIDY